MTEAANLVRHEVYLSISGKKDQEFDARLIEMEVDTLLGAASMCMLRFHDNDKELVQDSGTFKLGNALKIEAKGSHSNSKSTIFDGEITSIEPRFSMDGSQLVIRGYDKRHRMTRGTKQRVFVNASFSDVVKSIAGEYGLSADIESTTPIYDHIYQDNQSDYDFISQLARRTGYYVGIDGTKLQFKKLKFSTKVTVKFGEALHDFRPRMNVAGIPDEVLVKGWDPVALKEIIGRKSSSTVQNSIGDGSNGISTSSNFGAGVASYYVPSVKDQRDAEKVAQALLDHFNSRFIEADGIVYGQQEVLAGVKLTVEEVGSRFSGDYSVSAARHHYYGGTYEVHFRCEGAKASMISDMIGSSRNGDKHWGGVVPAIVTNIKESDSDKTEMVSVKIKFPWLDDKLEGTWARVSSIGGHKSAGIYWIPEVEDEVLVAFENGDFNRPYVIGSLWNGKNAPPEKIAQAQDGQGIINIRTIQTPAGHIIRLTDKQGEEKIEIIDAKGGTTITIDGKEKSTMIKSGGDITLDAGGKLVLKSGSDVSMEAKANVGVDAGAGLTMKAKANGELSASATLTVKGAMVKIN